MARIPEFFQPKIVRDGDTLRWNDITWDKSGKEVCIGLNCLSPESYEDETKFGSMEEQWRATMRMAAWQAVWEMAQKDYKP